MKFVFSLVIFLAPIAWARPVILLSYHQEEEQVQSLRKTLEEGMNIPPILISLEKKRDPCKKNTQAIAHICVEDGGKVKAPWVRQDVVKRNINPFFQE